MTTAKPSPGDPMAALLQRLRKGRKTNQRGAFGKSPRQRAAKVVTMAPAPDES